MRSGDVDPSWRGRQEAMHQRWRGLLLAERARDAELVARWGEDARRLVHVRDELTRSGQWRGGPKTLLSATGVAYRETALTAGLGWLLRPDGHHRAGAAVLNSFLHRLGLDASDPTAFRVVLEDVRQDTRADLVVYGPTCTVVVEAKVFAAEQPRQLDRLHALWQHDPSPRFVFLTRGAREPRTAELSAGDWCGWTWREVATMVREALRPLSGTAPGVHDYLTTLEEHHGD